MARVSNPYAQRRQQYRQTLAEQQAAMGDILAGVAGIDETLERQRQQRIEGEDRDARRKREEAQDARMAELDRERAEDRKALSTARAADTAARAAETARKTSAAEAEAKERAAKETRERVIERTRQTMTMLTPRSEVEKAAAEAGMSPDELLASVADIDERMGSERAEREAKRRKMLADAERAERGPAGPRPMSPSQRRIEDARVREAEARAQIAEREAKGPGKAAAAPAPAVGAQAATRQAKVAGLAADLDLLERSVAEVEKSGMDPGQVTGRVRSLKSAVVDDEAQTAFEAAAAAVNSQIFGLLRTDAPSESEARVIQALQFYPSDTPAKIRAKMRTVRAIIRARGADDTAPLDVLHNRVNGATTVPDDVAPVPPARSGDDEFDSLPQ